MGVKGSFNFGVAEMRKLSELTSLLVSTVYSAAS